MNAVPQVFGLRSSKMRPDTSKSAHAKFGMTVFSVKLFGRDSHPKRVTEQYGVLSKTADEIETFWTDRSDSLARAAQFIYRRRASPKSEGSPVRPKPEGRRQAVEHAQIHGGAAQGLPVRR